MKRFGLFVCTILFAVGLFGGFLAPKSTSAQTTKPIVQVTLADKTLLEDFAKEIIIIEEEVVRISGFDAAPLEKLNPEGSMRLGKKYLEILQSSYDSIKNDPTKTAAFLKFRTSTAYLNFIDGEILVEKGSAAYQDVLNRVRIIANQQNGQAVSRLNLEEGKIDSATNANNIKNANSQSAASNVVAANKAANPVVEECGIIGKGSIIACISEGFTWIIKNIFLNIAGFFLWLTANLFNYAVKIGVLEFAKWAPEQLYATWIIVRQIISLLIVFIGLYLGFMYILGKDEKFQRYIPWVIMFALFVNFSYPITRTAIDLSNIVSLNIYSSVVGTNVLDGSDGSYKNSGGDLIVSKLGLQGLVMSATTKGQSSGMLGEINSVPAALLAVCYVLYAAYIFFMVTALFVLRTVALVFLTVASPLLLVDSVFPMLGEKAKLLRKIFFEQLVIGPIFMIMFALTVKFLDVFSVLGKTDSFSSQASAVGSSTITTFFNILMMLIMLWIMLKVTKSAAGSLGEYATNAMGTVGGFAVGAATGGIAAGSGLLARKGIGALAAKARDSKWITNNQDSFIGRRAYNLSNAVANSTFDIRNSAVAQKVSSKMGFSMGMGTKMGYDEEWKAKVEQKKKEALDRSSRIKTHYERDVYKDKLDENKKPIYEYQSDGKGGTKKVRVQEIVHRKGDVDAEGESAKMRLISAAGGGTLFMTKKQKEQVKEALAQKEAQDSDKMIASVKAASTRDAEIYKSLKESETLPDGTVITAKQSKAKFLAGLEKELGEVMKTDKVMRGNQAQSLFQSIEAIKKIEADEKAAFDKQVKDAFNNYSRKRGQDQEDYFTHQTEEIQNAINEILADEQQAARNATNNALDLDLTQPSQAKRQSGIDAARSLAPQVQAILADKPLHGAVPINSPDVDIPLEGGGASSSSKPFDVSQVSTVDFAANHRAEKLKIATEAARAEMDRNSNKVVHPVPGEPIPSAQAQAPTTPASNQEAKNTAVA